MNHIDHIEKACCYTEPIEAGLKRDHIDQIDALRGLQLTSHKGHHKIIKPHRHIDKQKSVSSLISIKLYACYVSMWLNN